MSPLIILVMLVLKASWTTGSEGMETHHLYAAIGTSVSFPGEKIDNYTVYDLVRTIGAVVVACHGDCKVRDPYTQRGRFFQHNGTFLLTQLTEADNGTFEYKVNLTLKGRIHLWVMAPVMDPILKQESKENGTQCQAIFTCQAKGDGPLNFTFLRKNTILHNVTHTGNSISLSMDGWHPETSGIFSCEVTNAVSSKISPSIVFLPPVKPWQMEMVLVVIGLFLQWGVTMLYSLSEMCLHKCRKTNREQFGPMNGYSDEGDQRSRTCSLFRESLTMADNLLGFIKEFLAVLISLYGYIIPRWCCVIPGIFFVCRMVHSIIQLVNSCRKTRENIYSWSVKVFCAWAIYISSKLGVLVFCVAVLVIFYKYYSCPCPCGMTDKWPYLLIVPIAFLAFFVLCFFFYMYLNCKANARGKQQSQPEEVKTPLTELQNEVAGHVPIGGRGQPEDNRRPDCEEHLPRVVVDIPNGDQGNPEQEASCENSSEEGPEDQLIPQPKEGQSQGSVEITCKNRFRAAPNHKDTDGTEDTEGQCLLTVPTKVVALDKDRVANG